MKNLFWLLAVLMLAVSLAGCGDDTEGSSGDDPLKLIGTWEDDWGTTHSITAETWTAVFADTGAGTFTAAVHITFYDNEEMFLVGQNDSTASYYPDLWSRYDWAVDGEDLYYCQIQWDADDEETATEDDSADRSDLSTGCGGFGWSLLTPLED